ncbi:hypothetical protein COCSUDRAFT_34031 [Coccomyxa subellipsoidea C-169]|uniref:Uncharacterized protein n=1 Tax=Coccomyxa subellipsoidea (strain C-169) TaxID=574566 RepID=I0YNV3_COCSC|nr:hypothetical protein COCSUDRAFT_34031 [Coccomyxa subellipsoidea C-169]EIE20072.1 hypothetical protein COCSUDRAFT_34031 [Coccomyxa subellipsoidea C-169]|eukprot:XP_005644616.1 hypothetical protein COCSUDRAFT_34031 [Coccomyxa subellipsoidea C-169]
MVASVSAIVQCICGSQSLLCCASSIIDPVPIPAGLVSIAWLGAIRRIAAAKASVPVHCSFPLPVASLLLTRPSQPVLAKSCS